MNKTVLVTGASGLVGSALKDIHKKYPPTFKFVSSADCNLCDFKQTVKLFENIKPHYCIHLAADVGGLLKNINNNVSMLENNLLMNFNVVKCCHDFKVEKGVFCLSTCIFPDDTQYPIDETMIHNGPPHTSNEGYAYSKRMLEIHVRQYANMGDNFVCVIPTNIYGPHDNFSLIDGHVIPSLIHKCYLAKKNNTPFVIGGSGRPLRQFIYSRDLAELIMWTLECDISGNIILSCSEQDEISIETLGRIISQEFQYNNVVYDNTIPDGQYKKTATNTKLLQHHQSYTFTSIDIGIKNTIQWFINNFDYCRT